MRFLELLFCIVLLLCFTGCNKNNDNELRDSFKLELIEINDCDNQVIEYDYNLLENRRIYFVCLDEIFIVRENAKKVTLKYHFHNAYQSFDSSVEQLIKQMEVVDIFKDGGTTLYQKDNYRILVCKKEDGTRDLYLGDSRLTYQENFCLNRDNVN